MRNDSYSRVDGEANSRKLFMVVAMLVIANLLAASPAESATPIGAREYRVQNLPSAELVALFESHEYHYTGGRYSGELFRYRLFVPRSLKPEERYPLLVWLHGVGNGGSDNLGHLVYLDDLILNDFSHLENYQFFILAVQCPPANPYWYGSGEIGSDMLSVKMAILQETMRNYPIDPDRLYVAGASCPSGKRV